MIFMIMLPMVRQSHFIQNQKLLRSKERTSLPKNTYIVQYQNAVQTFYLENFMLLKDKSGACKLEKANLIEMFLKTK